MGESGEELGAGRAGLAPAAAHDAQQRHAHLVGNHVQLHTGWACCFVTTQNKAAHLGLLVQGDVRHLLAGVEQGVPAGRPCSKGSR